MNADMRSRPILPGCMVRPIATISGGLTDGKTITVVHPASLPRGRRRPGPATFAFPHGLD